MAMSWRLSILSRQRRRGPSRRMPKNVFNQGASNEQKKPQTTPIPKATPPKVISAPPKVAGSIPKAKPEKEKKVKVATKIVEKILEEVIIKEEIIPEIIAPEETKTKEIISEQILGVKPKKSRGLKQIKKKETVVKDPNVQSDRAAALIEQSRKRAMVPIPKPVVKEKVVKPAPRRRRAPKSSYQPVSYTHLRAHETKENIVLRLVLLKKN